jgi:two-component system, LytTR family, response regulator
MSYRTLIVDDEPIARRGMRMRLAAQADFEVVGECGDGAAAIESILELKPDVVFLDIQMPEVDGFEVVAALKPEQLPAVVFVTAFDQYALKAFDVQALDYVLKPIDGERFERTLVRIREQLARSQPDQNLAGRIEHALARLRQGGHRAYADRLAVRTDYRVRIIEVADIDWVQAAGNYVELHVATKVILMRSTLTELTARLDPERFVQVSRSALVQVRNIRELQPGFDGDYVLLLNHGATVSGSRRYRQVFSRLGL